MWTATLQINKSMEQFRTGKRMRKTANNIIICKYFQFWYNNHTTQHGCVQINFLQNYQQYYNAKCILNIIKTSGASNCKSLYENML